MKIAVQKSLSAMLIAVLLFPFSICALAAPKADNNTVAETDISYTDSPYFLVGSGGHLQGMYVESEYNKDYPAFSNATAAELNAQADEVLSFAEKYGYDSIFYSAAPGLCAMYPSRYLPESPFFVQEKKWFNFSDPLKVLCETAEAKRQKVCVVLDPFTIGKDLSALEDNHPAKEHLDWVVKAGDTYYLDPTNLEVQRLVRNIVTELVTKYSVSGVMLKNIEPSVLSKTADDYYEAVEGLIYQCYRVTKQQAAPIYFGICTKNTTADLPKSQEFILNLAKDSIDFIMLEMDASVSSSQNTYMDYLSRWQTALEGYPTQLFTMNLANKLTAPVTGTVCFGDSMEINYQLYANVLNGINGSVIYSYQDLKFNSYPLANDLTTIPKSPGKGATLLQYPASSGIFLSENESIVFTQESRYYVSGLCDPSQPLTLNGETLPKVSPYGGFGVMLPVQKGVNTYLFEQEKFSKKLILVSSTNANVQTSISDIQPDSVFPKTNQSVTVGETITLSCVAPYGGSVEARFNGTTYHMSPQTLPLEQQVPGTPVTYSVTVPIEHQTSTQVTNLGKVSYVLTYQDFTSKYRSLGEYYAVGSSSRLAVEVNASLGRVYRSSQEHQLMGNFQYGTQDFVSNIAGDYYHLASGGYIHKNDASIIEGFIDIEKSVQNVGIQSTPKGENFIFVGSSGVPYYTSYDPVSHILTLTLHNLSEMPRSLAHLNSRLFQKINVTANTDKGIMTIQFIMKDGQALWGYNVSLKDGNLILQCKGKQTVSTTEGKPLENITVVLDPARGGRDIGGVGLIGNLGPSEKDINLSLSYMLSRRLQSLGATVHLTRSEDVSLPSEDRILYNEFQDADFFISLQTDAVTKKQDGNRFYGLQVYYDSEFSTLLGGMMYQKLTQKLSLTPRVCTIDTDFIEQVPLAQSLIIKTGYVTNPEDYGRLSDPLEMYKLACAIADTLVEYLKAR